MVSVVSLGAAAVMRRSVRAFFVRTRNAARVAVGCCGVQLEAAEVFCVALRCVARLWAACEMPNKILCCES